MFVVLDLIHFFWIALLADFLIAFIYWRRPLWGLGFVIFFSPLYLIKFQEDWASFTLLESMIIFVFLVWLFKKIREKRIADFKENFKKIFKSFFGWPIVLILGGATLATTFSPDKISSFGILKSWIIEPLIFAGLVFEEIKNQRQLNLMIRFLEANVLSLAMVALAYFLAGNLTFDGRLAAFFLSPNHLAMALAPGLILFFKEIVIVSSKKNLFFLIGVISLIVLIFYFTFSYSAWLAVAFSLFFSFLILFKKEVFSLKSFCFLMAFLVVVFLFLFSLQFFNVKFHDLLFSDRSSWQSRLMIWRVAGVILKDHWFLGIGPGMFQRLYLDYQKYFPPYLEWAVPQPHNLFLAWWLQAGIGGLIGFLWLLKKIFCYFFKKILKPSFKEKDGLSVLVFLFAILIYWIFHGLVDTPYWKNDLSLIFWAIIALSYKAIRLGG